MAPQMGMGMPQQPAMGMGMPQQRMAFNQPRPGAPQTTNDPFGAL